MDEREEIKHQSFGNICINRVQTNGYNMFGDTTGNTNNSLININFNKSKLIKSFGEHRFSVEQNVLDIYLTKNQWVTLLTTMNNSNGVPCTISFREDISKMLNFNKKNSEKVYENGINKVKTAFEEDFNKIFPDMRKKIKKLSTQINQDNIENFERKQILNDVQGIIQSFYDNKEKILNILSKNIEKLDNVSSSELANQIKTNFFNFNIPKDIEEAKKILLNSSKDLGFNLIGDIKKEEIVPTEDFEAVMVLKEIESDYFIADNDCKNGYSFEVFEAKKTKVDNIIIITPNKKLIEYHLSVNQFGDLLTSFGHSSGITSTIKETITLKNIEPYTENKNDDFDFKLKKFEDLFNGRNKQLDTLSEKFSHNLKNKNISKSKQREMEIDLNTIMYRSYDDVLSIFNEIVDSRNKTILKKLNDVLSSLNKGIKNLGLKRFIDNLKNNDKTLLENITKKHSSENLLENKKQKVIEDKSLGM